jgi:hypothetical protein
MAKQMIPGTTVQQPRGQLISVDPKTLQACASIGTMVAEHREEIARADSIGKALLMGALITNLRNMIGPEVMQWIMPLQNSPNGFKTDRAGEGYPPEVVKECLITALVHGVHPVNNEWNIIAGQCYIALNGYKRLFESIPGISHINIIPGTPTQDGNIAKCRVSLSWCLDGVRNELTDHEGKPGVVLVIHQRGQSPGFAPDQIIGKAKRKAYKMAYEKATGSSFASDMDDGVAVVSDETKHANHPALPPGAANRLAARLAESKPEPVPVDDLEAEDAQRREEER